MNDTGVMKQFDTNDVVFHGSPTYGQPRIPKKQLSPHEQAMVALQSEAQGAGEHAEKGRPKTSVDDVWEYGTCVDAFNPPFAVRKKASGELEWNHEGSWKALNNDYAKSFKPLHA